MTHLSAPQQKDPFSYLDSVFSLPDASPIKTFTAAAGRNYGHVSAWALDEGFLVSFETESLFDCDIADDIDNLGIWLEDQEISGIDVLVDKANIYGIETISEAQEMATGPFYILAMHQFGEWKRTSICRVINGHEFHKFSTYREAKNWIDAANKLPYTLEWDQVSRPTFKIVTA